eukprot:56084-Chlamydomonas_euryale.AAC.1
MTPPRELTRPRPLFAAAVAEGVRASAGMSGPPPPPPPPCCAPPYCEPLALPAGVDPPRAALRTAPPAGPNPVPPLPPPDGVAGIEARPPPLGSRARIGCGGAPPRCELVGSERRELDGTRAGGSCPRLSSLAGRPAPPPSCRGGGAPSRSAERSLADCAAAAMAAANA